MNVDRELSRATARQVITSGTRDVSRSRPVNVAAASPNPCSSRRVFTDSRPAPDLVLLLAIPLHSPPRYERPSPSYVTSAEVLSSIIICFTSLQHYSPSTSTPPLPGLLLVGRIPQPAPSRVWPSQTVPLLRDYGLDSSSGLHGPHVQPCSSKEVHARPTAQDSIALAAALSV